MIQAKDLRIGNWVYIDGMYQQVYDVMCDSVNTDFHNAMTYENVQGIPLNEEWLIKLGFEKPDPNDLYGGLLIPINHEYKLRLIKSFDIWTWEHNDKHIVLLPYIHTLQNLFYSLSGEELKVKE